MKSIISRMFGRPLLLGSAALVLHAGLAVAADPSGDAQSQARNLLSGISTGRSTAVAEFTARPDRALRATALGAQEQARAFIAGTRGLGVNGESARDAIKTLAAPERIARAPRRDDPDALWLAQRTLLGATG